MADRWMDEPLLWRLSDLQTTWAESLFSELSATIADAAAEIKRLTEWRKNALLALDKREAEIQRLRAAGDVLAKQITSPCRCVEAHDGAINETCAPCAAFFDWQEARRG